MLAGNERLDRWFDVHDEELGLFLWTVALLFLVRSSGIFLNNYAEMAFLKRYGVEYMPVVNMINAVATFFVMGIMTGFMTRLPGASLLAGLFVFCGVSVAVIRMIIPFGIDLVYPALFMLKSQYEVLLALLFWNLANDWFNTRQSKRLFPLITAGGVVGQILGSFATPVMARWLHIDNLLVVYMATTLIGASVVLTMGRRYPTLLFQQKRDEANKSSDSIVDELKAVLPMMRSSLLLKILVVLTFLPNVLIPIMNYQFNYAVNEQFATESGLIVFFGYFRGMLNIINLVILLFVGKLYNRFGLPVALMFHPFNYVVVFLTMLLRFDAVAAVYARMSSNIIRTTLNIPAKAVLTGLFPESYRAMVRPFLRGTVVRVGLILGSGLILLSEPLFHPRYLSLAAMPFALAWAITPFVLKRRYTDILSGLLAEESNDFDILDEEELNYVFQDRNVQENVIQQLRDASGKNRLWTGRLLRSVGAEGLNDHLLKAIRKEQDNSIRTGLIELLSDQAGSKAVGVFSELVDPDKPDIAAAMIKAGHRMSPDIFAALNQDIYESSSYPLDVKARAVGSLYTVNRESYGKIIKAWLDSEKPDLFCAGLIAVGVCRDKRFACRLKYILSNPIEDNNTLTLVLTSLHAIQATGLNTRVEEYLESPAAQTRRAALSLFQIKDEASLMRVVSMLGDDVEDISRLAREKIKKADYQNSLQLVKSLSMPRKKTREALLDLLGDMAIKDLDVYRFVRFQARTCYNLMAQAQEIRDLEDGDPQHLLSVHLDEQVWFELQTILRVLGVHDPSGRMRPIIQGILSSDRRRQANGLEAVDNILDGHLKRLLMPLLEAMDGAARRVDEKQFSPRDVEKLSKAKLFESLLESSNWVTLTLSLNLLWERGAFGPLPNRVKDLGQHPNPYVAEAAAWLIDKNEVSKHGGNGMEGTSAALVQKLIKLKEIDLFDDLLINEMADMASVTGEMTVHEGEKVLDEDDRGEMLYLILEGDVSVIEDSQKDKEIELNRIYAGEYFGEMAVFQGEHYPITIRTSKGVRLLTLSKQAFHKIVHTHPRIGLYTCRVLTQRIRRLHTKIKQSTSQERHARV